MIGSGSSGWTREPLVRDRLEQLEREADAERLMRLVRHAGARAEVHPARAILDHLRASRPARRAIGVRGTDGPR
jgi:hypothetical protein